jgi:hypothetical protein
MTQQEYYNKYKYKYPSWDYFIHCGDYENYVKHYTKFVFDYVEPPPHGPPDVPVPGALPLFVSGVGLFGGLLYRRNRKQARG